MAQIIYREEIDTSLFSTYLPKLSDRPATCADDSKSLEKPIPNVQGLAYQVAPPEQF